MKLYIRAHDLGVKGIDSVIDRLDSLQLDGVQLVAYTVLPEVPYAVGGIDLDKALAVAGKEVALIGAYFNPVHSNVEKVNTCKQIFKEYIRCAKSLGCGYVGSETGSYNDDKWTYHPGNRTDEALQIVVRTFAELADYAAECGVSIAMEGASGHVCHSVARLKQAIDLINRPNVKVIFDLYNYLDVSNADSCYRILNEGLAVFGRQIEIFHLKDFDIRDGKLVQCPVGKGILDYDYVLKQIYACDPSAKLVFEGTTGEDIPQAVEYIRSKIQKLCN